MIRRKWQENFRLFSTQSEKCRIQRRERQFGAVQFRSHRQYMASLKRNWRISLDEKGRKFTEWHPEVVSSWGNNLYWGEGIALVPFLRLAREGRDPIHNLIEQQSLRDEDLKQGENWRHFETMDSSLVFCTAFGFWESFVRFFPIFCVPCFFPCSSFSDIANSTLAGQKAEGFTK